MLDEGTNPDQISNQFKAADQGLQKAHFVLLDEVFLKSLALKLVQYWALSMALVSIIAALLVYGPRLNVTCLAALRKPGISGSFVYGLIFSSGTSAAPLLLLHSVAAANANPFLGFTLALCLELEEGYLS